MNRFDYVRANSVADAIAALAGSPNSKFLAGGTNLVDLMKYDVARPSRIIDINRLPLKEINETVAGGLRIGSLATNSDVAWHPQVAKRYPLLSSAILAGASAQLRNAATTGGNLLQRTRCYYFYDSSTHCNKRLPSSGCDAIGGANRIHAILGSSDACIAVHPSDMCVALAALDAEVEVEGPKGKRLIPFALFHRLPDQTPEQDNTLELGELITAVVLPAGDFGPHHTYIKIRDRLSYAFALISVAAALKTEDGIISEVRLAMGGVAHKPWRDRALEEVLRGKPPTEANFAGFARDFLRKAQGRGQNDFKIELGRRTIVRALMQAARGTPQNQSDKVVR
jgi:xanthine dehydrogenase YagS FAD-binding subunit